jgi:hypothetical protein
VNLSTTAPVAFSVTSKVPPGLRVLCRSLLLARDLSLDVAFNQPYVLTDHGLEKNRIQVPLQGASPLGSVHTWLCHPGLPPLQECGIAAEDLFNVRGDFNWHAPPSYGRHRIVINLPTSTRSSREVARPIYDVGMGSAADVPHELVVDGPLG